MIYNAPYSPHYPAQGNTALTDGIRGDWTYGDGSWQGFIDKKRLDVTIDMGTETAVHSVSADFMQVVGAEVFLPESVTISISDDGANFTELKQYTFEEKKLLNLLVFHGKAVLKDGIYVIRLVPEKSLADGYLQMK